MNQEQQIQHFRTTSSCSHRGGGGGGLKYILSAESWPYLHNLLDEATQ